MVGPTALVIDQNAQNRSVFRQAMEGRGWQVLEARTDVETWLLTRGHVDVVVQGDLGPEVKPMEMLQRLNVALPQAPVIVALRDGGLENAMEAMHQGAHHVVDGATGWAAMPQQVVAALERVRHGSDRVAIPAPPGTLQGLATIIGESPVMKEFKGLLARIAVFPRAVVLLTGETGTGKDLAARALHQISPRASGPFMHITCSALPEALLESELFGHERGAYTDAKSMKKGLLELAQGGTVFLDEIGEMPANLQAKLLRFLEERTFKRVGGSADIHVDTTVVSATNRDLVAGVRSGRFREDLYYRLMMLPLELPPLRQRTGDVPLLVKHYVARASEETSRQVEGVSDEAMHLLDTHAWPGNVRELRNQVHRAVMLSDGTVLQTRDFRLTPQQQQNAASPIALPRGGIDFDQLERDLVVQALRQAGGHHARAGALLKMNRDQVRYRIEKYGLEQFQAAARGKSRAAEEDTTPAPPVADRPAESDVSNRRQQDRRVGDRRH